MPASIEFATKVYAVVALIPAGRVTTYGRIAAHVGDRRGARMVGWALMDVPRDRDLPCHRVVNRVGLLSGGWHFGHPEVMAGLLRAEGIEVSDEFTVDLKAHLWDPADALVDGELADRSPPEGASRR